ncbi:MAG TPA: lysophospholipid acyltransferase family protein [Armatimonadota bacterium]|nr:lysophospholipid acyltransferase family protein [Armatimonadota bacterium]
MLYWIGWILCRLALTIFGRYKAVGAGNVPSEGGVILAPNHVSYIDPPAAGCGIRKRQVRFMAKSELFKIPVLGYLIDRVGAFPVKQNTADRAALKKAMDLINSGNIVCLFPEGTRSLIGELMEAQPGLGMIALKTKAPVVPAALIGTNKMLPPHSWYLHFSRIKVVYGKPMTFDDLYEKGMSREAIEQVGERVMAAIAELLEQHSFKKRK